MQNQGLIAKSSAFLDVYSFPFGVTLEGRNFTLSGAEDFRYGFQGQEMDDEIKGEGNSVNYKYRMHDPRVGRFFAVDPLAGKYPWYTPYSFSGNKVINSAELEGLEEFTVIQQADFEIIVWDISARNRKGESGKIMFINSCSDIIQAMRPLNEIEGNVKWIQRRLASGIEESHHLPGGTDLSLARPSTGLSVKTKDEKTGKVTSKIHREARWVLPEIAPPKVEKDLKTSIKKAKKTLTSEAKSRMMKDISGSSVIAYTPDRAPTPILNKDNDGFGNIKDVAKELNKYEFSKISISLSLAWKKQNTVGSSGTPAKLAENMLNDIIDGMVSSGIPRSKIEGSSNVLYKESDKNKFNVTIK